MKDPTLTPDRFLTRIEIADVLQKAEEQRAIGIAEKRKQPIRDWMILRLFLLSGITASEGAGLKVVDCYVGYAKAELRIQNGRGGKSRMVKIGQGLKKDLRWYIRWKKENGELNPDAYLLRSQRSEKMTPGTIWRRFKKYCPNHRLQDVRYTNANLVYQASKDLRFVQKQMGYSRLSTTSAYAQRPDKEAEQYLNNMDRMVRQSKEELENGEKLATRKQKHCELAQNYCQNLAEIAGSIASS